VITVDKLFNRKFAGYAFNIFMILVVVSAALFAGHVAAKQDQYLNSKIEALKDHNERLIKALERSEARHNDAQVVIASTSADQEQLVANLLDAKDYLWMASTALDELERVIQENDQEADIRIIIRDIRDVINQANTSLGQALSEEIAQVNYRESIAYNLDPYLLTAMAYRESTFRPDVRGKSGEFGLIQIMPGTGKWIAEKLGYTDWSPEQLLDVETNVRFAAYYLSISIREFGGDVQKGVLAYNRGSNGARKWMSENRPEDHGYVSKVMATYRMIANG
jgi:soluble lytic murein transglycosylase-like protein